MKSLARVIPTVVAHELKDMGELVDIDSDQVQEEIVSVVDEVGYNSCVETPEYCTYHSARAGCPCRSLVQPRNTTQHVEFFCSLSSRSREGGLFWASTTTTMARLMSWGAMPLTLSSRHNARSPPAAAAPETRPS